MLYFNFNHYILNTTLPGKTKTLLIEDKGILQIDLSFRSDNNIIKTASESRKGNNTLQKGEGDRQKKKTEFLVIIFNNSNMYFSIFAYIISLYFQNQSSALSQLILFLQQCLEAVKTVLSPVWIWLLEF